MSHEDIAGEVLGAVRAAVPGASMHTPVQRILSAARARRRRRGLAAVTGAALAVTAGLTVSLTSAGGRIVPPAPAGDRTVPPAPGGSPKLAAFSVRTSPGGVVTLTLRQFASARALQHALAANQVRAIVRIGDFICGQRYGMTLPGVDRVITSPQQRTAHAIVIQIRPAAMPAGSELLFSLTSVAGSVKYVGYELLRVGDPINCQRPPI